jgi:putative ABC transport system permease protein
LGVIDFRTGVFLRGAALGFSIPLVATILPVARAVRVAPVDAIRTTHRAASGGLAPLLQRVPLPGTSLAQLPFRNVLRAPRRSLLTALGIAAAITTLVGVVGMIDSYLATLDRSEDEILGEAPDRMVIDLELAPVQSEGVRSVLSSPLLSAAEPRLHLGGVLDPEGEAIDVFLTVGDLSSPLWAPTAVRGTVADGRPGLVLSRKAADDLGIGVGDPVLLRHPRRDGAAFALVETELPVVAVHPDPFRFVAFVDLRHAQLFGLEGFANAVQAEPGAGVSVGEAMRGLFGQQGVVSIQPVDAQVEAVRDRIDDFLAIFTIVQVAVLVLALLIAFNASNITLDERRREHATMFAYGVPVWRVLRSGVVESLVTGLAGIFVGIAAGRLLVGWLTTVLLADTLPDIEVLPTVAVGTVATALALGTIAVTLAPLFTVRRLRKMDIPSTLRVME